VLTGFFSSACSPPAAMHVYVSSSFSQQCFRIGEGRRKGGRPGTVEKWLEKGALEGPALNAGAMIKNCASVWRPAMSIAVQLSVAKLWLLLEGHNRRGVRGD